MDNEVNDNQINNPESAGNNRNEKGQFVPGVSGNPNGRPEGTISITTEIKRKLLEKPKEGEKTYLQLLIEKILLKAIKDGDSRTIKQIWNYIDGMPKQEIEGKLEGVQIDMASLVKTIKEAMNGKGGDNSEGSL